MRCHSVSISNYRFQWISSSHQSLILDWKFIFLSFPVHHQSSGSGFWKTRASDPLALAEVDSLARLRSCWLVLHESHCGWWIHGEPHGEMQSQIWGREKKLLTNLNYHVSKEVASKMLFESWPPQKHDTLFQTEHAWGKSLDNITGYKYCNNDTGALHPTPLFLETYQIN